MRFRAKIVVSPKRGISDPEGDTLRDRLRRKENHRIIRVRSGKYWEIDFESSTREEAEAYINRVSDSPPLMNRIKDDSELLELEEVK
ncbi:MAG: phosphoribosylformylglycinamidine synthase subunit PurS [Candidatus Bathyarchaeia archaeon]